MSTQVVDFTSDLQLLESLGARFTGSDAHRILIKHVASELASLGLSVQRDSHTFMQWDAPRDHDRLRLTVDGNDVPISAAYPYSGATGPHGVSGRLQLLTSPVKDWSPANGAIAVVEVPNTPIPWDKLFGTWDAPSAHAPFLSPVTSTLFFGPSLDAAKAAGVLGVVTVWRGLSVANAARQYLPFTEPYHDLPAVWVAGEFAQRILAAAGPGSHAHLVLDATLTPDCPTETVWVVSPGASATETIVVVTHSDGVNTVEENGHIGLLELARDAVAQPHQRTIVFVYTTGHLRIPAMDTNGQQAGAAWLNAHPDLWAGKSGQARAVAAISMEHFGAREFSDGPQQTYGPTGRPEPELLYATTRELRDLLCAHWTGADPGNTSVTAPVPGILFGELQPFYQRQIPGISLVTAPQYLLAEREGDLVDPDAMGRQIDSFRRLQRLIDAAPVSSLGTVQLPSP
jgi:hypothetical protein